MLESPTPEPNWGLAKALYLQNLPLKTIASQANLNYFTLRTRIQREDWLAERTKLQADPSLAPQLAKPNLPLSVSENPDVIARIGHGVRQQAAGALQRVLEGLDTGKRPKSIEARRALAELVKIVTDSGKVLFQWEDQKPALLIDLATLRKVRLPGEPKPIEIASQVVVQAQPTPETGDVAKQSTTHNVAEGQQLNSPQVPQ
jgi:hypothetical protein